MIIDELLRSPAHDLRDEIFGASPTSLFDHWLASVHGGSWMRMKIWRTFARWRGVYFAVEVTS